VDQLEAQMIRAPQYRAEGIHALVNLIYGAPTWVMASVVIAIIGGLSLIGRVISSRVLHPEIRRRHNER
jgi:hypothetical protein